MPRVAPQEPPPAPPGPSQCSPVPPNTTSVPPIAPPMPPHTPQCPPDPQHPPVAPQDPSHFLPQCLPVLPRPPSIPQTPLSTPMSPSSPPIPPQGPPIPPSPPSLTPRGRGALRCIGAALGGLRRGWGLLGGGRGQRGGSGESLGTPPHPSPHYLPLLHPGGGLELRTGEVGWGDPGMPPPKGTQVSRGPSTPLLHPRGTQPPGGVPVTHRGGRGGTHSPALAQAWPCPPPAPPRVNH